MRLLFTIVFLSACFAGYGQTGGPRYENDTVYTTKGYKIYIGQKIQLLKGTAEDGKFRFVKLDGGDEKRILTNRVFTVSKIKKYYISDLGNAFIRIVGKLTYDDGSKGAENLVIYFERALESFPGLPNEMLPPGEILPK